MICVLGLRFISNLIIMTFSIPVIHVTKSVKEIVGHFDGGEERNEKNTIAFCLKHFALTS